MPDWERRRNRPLTGLQSHAAGFHQMIERSRPCAENAVNADVRATCIILFRRRACCGYDTQQEWQLPAGRPSLCLCHAPRLQTLARDLLRWLLVKCSALFSSRLEALLYTPGTMSKSRQAARLPSRQRCRSSDKPHRMLSFAWPGRQPSAPDSIVPCLLWKCCENGDRPAN